MNDSRGGNFLDLSELRATMLAVDAELTSGGLGGPLMIESLANILAVRLLRYIFGLRRLVTRADGVLTRRKLTTIVDYLMANLHRSPTLEQMAALVSLSPYHFARQFKASPQGDFAPPQKSPKLKASRFRRDHRVGAYLAYSSSRGNRNCEFSDSIDREVCPAVHQPVEILRARQHGERVGRVASPRCHQYGGAGSGD